MFNGSKIFIRSVRTKIILHIIRWKISRHIVDLNNLFNYRNAIAVFCFFISKNLLISPLNSSKRPVLLSFRASETIPSKD